MNPFAQNGADALRSLGEVELIRRIRVWLGDANPPPPNGIGDDCAVFPPPAPDCQQLITTDPVLYGKHFDDTLAPEQVAAKLAKRNLSDIAAMGGRPTIATVSLAMDPNVSLLWLERFYRELAHLAVGYGFLVVGGDISSAQEGFFGAFLTLIGQTAPSVKPLLRHRAKSGSPIYVTGSLGGTRASKHYAFEPRLAEGQWLAHRPETVSCSDISDGLGKDLINLIADGHAAEIDARRVPISNDARAAAERTGALPLQSAFDDGEDYELVFALAPDADLQAFESAWKSAFSTPIARIGRVVEAAGDASTRFLNTPEGFSAKGYEHLR